MAEQAANSKKAAFASYIGLVLLAIVYAAATYRMMTVPKGDEYFGRKVIRIVHWQLESGYRGAIAWVISEYEKLHPGVKVIQLGVHEKAYGQYVQTQLIGQTAPDLIELGMFDVKKALGRYFVPLSQHLFKPNPHNEGTEFEDTPWIYTFTDGLRYAYSPENLEYFSAGLSMFTVRMFYNKDMFRRILGHNRAPQNYRELINVCEKITRYAEEHDVAIIPISSSKYQVNILTSRFRSCLTADYLEKLDMNFDLLVSPYERYLGHIHGKLNFKTDRQLEAAEEITKEISRHFTPGFMAMGRMEAGFSFVQQKAAMITSGSWDAMSYRTQAQFDMGVFDFPLPNEIDPDYGSYFDGKGSESQAGTGGLYGVTRFSKYPDVALDFLRFLTSKRINQEFNRRIQWLPAIRNTEVDDFMKPFLPHMDGFPAGDRYEIIGSHTRRNQEQAFWPYISDRIDYAEYAAKIEDRFVKDGLKDYLMGLEAMGHGIQPQEHIRSGLKVDVIFGDDEHKRKGLEKLSYIWESMNALFLEKTIMEYELERAAELGNDRAEALKELL